MSHTLSNSSRVSGVIALTTPGPDSFTKRSMMGEAESPSSQSPSRAGYNSTDSSNLSFVLFWRRTDALIAFRTAFVEGRPSLDFLLLAAAVLPLEDDWDDGGRCSGILLLWLFFFLLDLFFFVWLIEGVRIEEEEEEEREFCFLSFDICFCKVKIMTTQQTNKTHANILLSSEFVFYSPLYSSPPRQHLPNVIRVAFFCCSAAAIVFTLFLQFWHSLWFYYLYLLRVFSYYKCNCIYLRY